MSSQNTNGAAVSINYIPTSGPTTEGSISDDPPAYSECVPYPPPIISNCSKTNSSFPANLSEDKPANRIQNPGLQTETSRHDGIPSAPLIDVSPTLPPNYSSVYIPTITPNIVNLPTPNDSTQTNVPIHIHRTKILTRQINPDRAGSKGKSFKTCISGVFSIAACIIIVIVILRHHKQRIRQEEMIRGIDDVSIDLEESYGDQISHILNDNNDVFKELSRDVEYNKIMKIGNDHNRIDLEDLDLDGRMSNSGGDINNRYNSMDDLLKGVMNDFRKERNMPPLPSNMTFNEMYEETFSKIFNTDMKINLIRTSTKPTPTDPHQTSISNDDA